MKHSCLLLVLFLLTISNAQNSLGQNKTLEESYASYFEFPRETIYTHLNKTVFLTGENIWFKTYVRDRHFDIASKATTNINVGIYNEKGNLLKRGLWLATDGTSDGHILIDSTFTSGDYYVKTSTNWMRNFKESDAFTQKITIIGNDNKSASKTVTNSYDLQLLPEGGQMIYGATNIIGVKILDKNGKGVKVSGLVYDNLGNEITKLKTNVFGLGKFIIKPEQQKSYTVKVNLSNGLEVSQPIENIRIRGIIMQVNNSTPKNVIVTLSTNSDSYQSIKNKEYRIVIHKNGKLKVIPFTFNDKLTKSLIIPKTEFYSDINTITLFNDKDEPLLERLIFNSNFKLSVSNFSIKKLKKENDSLILSIYSSKSKQNDNSKLSDLSISVLPETTQAYNPEHNILTANYLKPYLKGVIESPMYYFKGISSKKLYDLDILLLTQGWSRYDWKDIFNGLPKLFYDFESGITISGKVNFPKDIKSLMVRTPELMGSKLLDIDLNEDKTFSISNFFPMLDEEIRFSYIDKNGKLKKPSLIVSYNVQNFQNKISPSEVFETNFNLEDAEIKPNQYDKTFFYDDAVKLDEVLITGQAKKQKEGNRIEVPRVTFKDNYIQMTLEKVRRYPTVLDVIRAKGYIVQRDSKGDIYIKNQVPSSINSSGTPLVYFDGVRLSQFTFLDNYPSSNIEGVIVDKSGLGEGMNGAEGVIKIFSRKTPLFDAPGKPDYALVSKATQGFQQNKEFYTPRYKSYTSNLFKYYGVIGWIPNIYLLGNKSEMFKVPDTKSHIINFYIEGYDSNGNLVSQVIRLSIE